MSQNESINAFVRLQLWEVVRAYLAIGLRRFQFVIAILGAFLAVAWIQLFRGYMSASADPWTGLSLFQNVLLLALLSLAFPLYLLVTSFAVARSCLRHNSNIRGGFPYSFSAEGLSYLG